MEVKNYAKATQYLAELLRLVPTDFEAYYLMGQCETEITNYYEAIENYTKSIELQPKFAAAYTQRGLAKVKLLEKEEKSVKQSNKVDVCKDLETGLKLGDKGAKEWMQQYCFGAPTDVDEK